MAALPPGNPEGEKRGPGAVKRSTKLCSGESQSEKHDEARDHPRACGENSASSSFIFWMLGSPPRMRGKRYCSHIAHPLVGITPAHAGKTRSWRAERATRRDHPRACGENHSVPSLINSKLGSPPRMRGKLSAFFVTNLL